MKFTNLRYAALLAFAGIALLTTSASAVNDYDAGDLLLGVRADAGTGVTQDIIVNLGPVSQFLETNTATIQVGPNLKSALDSTYGATWPARTNVFFSVSGTTGLSTVGSYGPKTLWATSARPDFTTSAAAWLNQSETAQGFTTAKMSAMATVYNNGTLASGVLIQPTSDSNSYASYMPGGTVTNSGGISFATFNPHIEGNPGQALDLFRMTPGGSGAGTFVGRFTVYSTGKLVFTPRDGIGAAFTSVQVEQPTYSVTENVGSLTIKIVRSGDPLVAFDVTANTVDGTALAATDYTAQLAQLKSFAAADAEKTLVIPILPRVGAQSSRDFTVALTGPTNSVTLGTNATSTMTITESAPTQFVLDAPAYTINEGGGSLAVTVTRTGGSDTNVSVQLTTTAGSATALDYTFTPAIQTLSFVANGGNTQVVNIPIVSDALVEANETFTVKLQGPLGGSLATPNSAPVTIIDPSSLTDAVLPTAPVITTPIAGLVGVNSPGTTLVTGTAADAKGVQFVQVSLNGGPFVNAALGTPGGISTTYSLAVTPLTGLNTIQVKSLDFRAAPGPNTSPIVTRTFTVTRPLLVGIVGTGTVTTGYSPTSFREVGKTNTVTAAPATLPAPGTIFSGWTILSAHTPAQIGIAASALEKATLTFVMREGLSLQATFVANPFAGVAGTYNGLIKSSPTLPDRAPLGGPVGLEDGTLPSNASEGFFTGTVQPTGAFSGKITIDSLNTLAALAAVNVSGTFDSLGRARFGTARALTITVPRPNKPSLIVKLDAALTAPFKITGTVTAVDFKKSDPVVGVSTVDSDRAYYNGTGPFVPDQYLSAPSAPNGIFTTVFPALLPGVQPPGFTTADYPQGDCIGTITVTKAGIVTFAGTLADGTTLVTASSTLSQANTFAFFTKLYTNQGFMSGMVTLNHLLAESDMSALSDMIWSRPFQNTQQWYPYGWPEVIKVGMKGAKYVNAPGQAALKKADGADGDLLGDTLNAADLVNGNANLELNAGLLTQQITKPLNISTANAVTKVQDPATDTSYSVLIAPATGMVTGVFTHENDTKPGYQAIIYQKGTGARAYGFFLTTKPTVLDYTGESGTVKLSGNP